MSFTVYKLSFKAPIHFGNGRLTTCNTVFYADTLFSALCKEALRIYGEKGIERLFGFAEKGELLISDSMPYCGDTWFIPNPIIHITGERRENASTLKKAFKKLKYIPTDDLNDFINGEYDPASAIKKSDNLGKFDLRAGVSVCDDADNEPFSIRNFTFADDCGLYFISKTESEDAMELMDELIDSLSYLGIGGRLSSGLGRFDFKYEELPPDLEQRFEGDFSSYMSLSLCMPDLSNEAEVSKILDGASYEIIARSGFVASETLSEVPQKKERLYCFKSGSCFKKRFNGAIFNVSPSDTHPVYRYAKPLFIGI